MAAPKDNQNAVGNSGGKSLQDRQLAAEVRNLTLTKIKALFIMPRVDMGAHEAELHDRILEKLAGSVLPRLNEHSGPEGEPIPLMNYVNAVRPDNGDPKGQPAK